MQVLQNLSKGLKHSCLMIRDIMFLTKGLYNLLRLFQFVAWHTWEEVMLNLIVQSAVPEIGNGMGVNVAGSEYLALQKAHFALLVQNRHAFVIWCKD